MTMKDLRDAENFGGLENGAGEKRKALGIIGIISCRRAIQTIPVEKFGIFHKIKANAGLGAATHDGSEPVLVVKGNGNAAHSGGRLGELGLAVARQIDRDLMSQRGQRPGQSAHHVGQSTGLGKRNAFGSCEYDLHGLRPSRAQPLVAAARYYEYMLQASIYRRSARANLSV